MGEHVVHRHVRGAALIWQGWQATKIACPTDSESSEVEYEMNYHEEELNYLQALTRLEELTGKVLTE